MVQDMTLIEKYRAELKELDRKISQQRASLSDSGIS